MYKIPHRAFRLPQIGAAFAEYLPLTSIVLLSMAVAAAHYGDALKGTGTALAAHLAGKSSGAGGGPGTGGLDPVAAGSDPIENEAPPLSQATDFGPYLAEFSQGFWRGAIARFAVLADFARQPEHTARRFTQIAAAFYLDPIAMGETLRQHFGLAAEPVSAEDPAALAEWLAARATAEDLGTLAGIASARAELGRALGPLSNLCASEAHANAPGCDTAARARDMGERVNAILAQVAPVDHALLAEELDADAATKLAMLERAALATAWSTLHEADYARERQSLALLRQTADLLEHPDLTASGFDQAALRSLIKGNNGPEGAELASLLTGLDTLISGDAVFENVGGLVREMELGGNFSVGTRFVLRDMTANAHEFGGTRVIFETPQQAVKGVSHIDLLVERGGRRQSLEYTSIKQVPPPGFARAIASDLSSLEITSLDQLKWRFDASKLTSLPRAQMLAALAKMEVDSAVLAKFGAADRAALVAQIDARFDTMFELR